MTSDEAFASLNKLIAGIKVGQLQPVDVADYPEEFTELVSGILECANNLMELQAYSLSLAKGDFDVTPPGRQNYLAAATKNLHMQLNHIAWQADQIAQGDYSQRVDFMGDFAEAFNTMVEQLSERENKLNTVRERMVGAFDSLYDIVVITSAKGEVLFQNKAAREVLPLQRRTGDSEKGSLLDAIQKAACKGEGEMEARDTSSNKWYLVKTSYMQWDEHKDAFIHSCTDITIRRQREQELQRAVEIDALTGIASRKAGLARLGEELANFDGSECLIVALVDIDNLKFINDTFGHTEGDHAIKVIAEVLQGSIRGTDMACRLSGDEFFLIMSDCSSDTMEKVLSRTREYLEEFNQSNPLKYDLNFSCGYYRVKQGDTAKDAIRNADEAMYIRKRKREVTKIK